MTINTGSALKVKDLLPRASKLRILDQNKGFDFWQLWKSSEDDLYKCCLKWLRGNTHEAEEVMSQAMIKGWHEWQKSGHTINSPKSWLTKIIHNLCMDVHRKKQRDTLLIENIDAIKFNDDSGLATQEELPESRILKAEMRAYLHYLISRLPDRLSSPLILHYYHNKPYKEIAKKLAISEESVRKRLKQARSILQNQLRKYLVGEDDTCLESFSPSLNREIPMLEEVPAEQAAICQSKSSIPTQSNQEEISYKVTVLGKETLPHHWYRSTNLLVWR